MPLYEYECSDHGSFDAFRPFSDANAPIACPTCGHTAVRVLTVPRMQLVGRATRIGMERNEKSRHEPHVCTAGCSHHHRPKSQPKSPDGRPKLQSYKGPRPWVVEHA